MPIFQSSKPSSCAECHLSGVDLKDYIRSTQQETFASLLAGGLIDVKSPDDSKLLRFIARAPDSPSLVSNEVRQMELEAFREWIRAAVVDPDILAARDSSAPAGPELPVEIVRHARKDRVLASFIDHVWNEVGRCAACHSPDRNSKQVEEHGEQVSWIILNDPQATLNYMLEQRLIDVTAPDQSLLLTKPTMQVDHVGGQKMVIGDRSYKQFRRFIDDYVAIVQGKYEQSNQLPIPDDEQSIVTDIWLKIEGVPKEYDKLLLQVDLYRATGEGWSESRVATSDRPIFGGGELWQHSLSLIARRGTVESGQLASQQLAAGRYLVKLYIDREGKLAKDFTTQLGEEDFVGQLEVESQWPSGYGQMTIVRWSELKETE